MRLMFRFKGTLLMVFGRLATRAEVDCCICDFCWAALILFCQLIDVLLGDSDVRSNRMR